MTQGVRRYQSFFSLFLKFAQPSFSVQTKNMKSWRSEDALIDLGTLEKTQKIASSNRIHVDLAYAGPHNFVGRKIPGYEVNDKAVMVLELALILLEAQKMSLEQGYCLSIFDAYRPKVSVEYFMQWIDDETDASQKEEYYPSLSKQDFHNGYLSPRSNHMTGRAVDITLLEKSTGKELNMGSIKDFLGPESAHSFEGIPEDAQQNRSKLKELMNSVGLIEYEKEWWHYSLDKPKVQGGPCFDVILD